MKTDGLLRCIYDSLSIFGDNTKTAILAQLQSEGVEFTPDHFDIDKFCTVIEDLLGHSADFIIVKIVDEYCRKSEISMQGLGFANRPYYEMHSSLLESLFTRCEMDNQIE